MNDEMEINNEEEITDIDTKTTKRKKDDNTLNIVKKCDEILNDNISESLKDKYSEKLNKEKENQKKLSKSKFIAANLCNKLLDLISEKYAEIKRLENQNSILTYEKQQKEKEIKNLQEEIMQLNQEIENQQKLFTNINTQTQKKVDDKFFNISEKLHIEYQDFESALNDEMTISLGENMRFQLKNIFKILKDAGINIY